MRVMTFNLRSDSIFDGKNRWNSRKEIVYDILDKYACDIIGLQEVTLKMHADLENYMIIKLLDKQEVKNSVLNIIIY